MGMRYDKNEEKAAYKDIESITSKKSCNKLKKVYNKYARILTDEDIDELNKISELLVTLVYIILINTECIKEVE